MRRSSIDQLIDDLHDHSGLTRIVSSIADADAPAVAADRSTTLVDVVAAAIGDPKSRT